MAESLNDRLDKTLRRNWAARREILRRLLKELDSGYVDHPGAESRRPHHGFTPEQYAVVTILQRFGHGVPVKAVAAEFEIPYANVTRTLDRLEKKGLVHRTKSKRDQREVIVRLTLEGGKVARRMAVIGERLEAIMWERYSDEEKLQLIALLDRKTGTGG